MLSRRVFLAAPAVLLAAARPELSLESIDSGRPEAFLAWPGGAVFTCPAKRARLLTVLGMGPLADLRQIAVVTFGIDAQDWLAFVDGKARLLALEPATLHRAGTLTPRASGTLTTRAAMQPDRRHIALERSMAIHDGTWRRESWTDYLRLDSDILVNAPPRMILPGTQQNALIAPRAAMAALLSPPPVGIPPEALSLARATLRP